MLENKVFWSSTALKEFGKVIDYIRQDSFRNAESVYTKVINKLDTVANNPGMCPPDKYKRHNSGNHRAFTIYRYRVSYRIEDEGIRILRIRHSSMKAKYY